MHLMDFSKYPCGMFCWKVYRSKWGDIHYSGTFDLYEASGRLRTMKVTLLEIHFEGF